MALCSTVHLPQSVLDLETVKRPLVTCLVGYVWVSELCTSSSYRQLCSFNMSMPLTNTSSDEVNISSTLSQERLTCILLMLALCDKTRACKTCLVDSVVKKAEQRFIMDRLLPILATVKTICFVHDGPGLLQAVQSPQLARLPHYSLQNLVEVQGLVNDLSQIQCIQFLKNLGLT